MNILTILILVFFMLGAADWFLGNKFGMGKEFEKGFALFVLMAFSMLGILVVAPAIGVWLTPVFNWFYQCFKIDPSIIPASLLANDMGGATLSLSVNHNTAIGEFNAYIVSAMMGTTISYTIPVALGLVKKEQYREVFFGLLCGIATVPIGCIVSGAICGINLISLLLTLLPLLIFSLIVALALVFVKDLCIKVFYVFGQFIRLVSVLGLACAAFTFLTKIEICKHFDTFSNAALICANGCVTLAGMLPFMYVLSKLLNKPIKKIGSKSGLDSTSALSVLTTIVSSTPTFGIMDRMNKKGVVLNSAFAVSAAFAVGGHLAFTMVFNPKYVAPMIIGKLISGAAAIILAMLLYKEPNAAE